MVTAPTNSFYYPGGDWRSGAHPRVHYTERDKLFFYAAYEIHGQKPAGSLSQYFVPTPADAARELTPAYIATLGPDIRLARIRDAYTLNATLFPGGQIPATQIDPNSAKILALMPAGT